MKDKPARLIERLQQALREQQASSAQLVARITDLERQVAAGAQRERDADALHQRVVAERDELASARRQREQLDAAVIQGMRGVLGADRVEAYIEDPVNLMRTLVAMYEGEIAWKAAEHARDAAAAQTRIADLEAREAEIDRKETEIKEIVARVEERMRAREREQASAILNRKAIAGAVPGRNRG